MTNAKLRTRTRQHLFVFEIIVQKMLKDGLHLTLRERRLACLKVFADILKSCERETVLLSNLHVVVRWLSVTTLENKMFTGGCKP